MIYALPDTFFKTIPSTRIKSALPWGANPAGVADTQHEDGQAIRLRAGACFAGRRKRVRPLEDANRLAPRWPSNAEFRLGNLASQHYSTN
jgi:hypothetical protein